MFGCPLFRLGKEDLGCAVGLFVRFERDFAVGAEDVDRVCDVLLNILDEVLNGLAEDRAFLRCERVTVCCRQICDLGCALVLLALAVLCKL